MTPCRWCYDLCKRIGATYVVDEHMEGCPRMKREMIVEACAQAAHEANRAYCAAIGDYSQPRWENAPDWQKDSAREGVKRAIEGATPRELHEGWMALKRSEGWKYGAVKNPEAKEHPCMVPYEDLSKEQQAKDLLFGLVVVGMNAALAAR